MIALYMASIVTTFGIAVWVLEVKTKKITKTIQQINKIIRRDES